MISRRSYASRSETNFQNSPFLQHPARLDAGEPIVALVFPVAARLVREEIHLGQILDHFVAEFDRRVETQRSAVAGAELMSVHAVGEHRLRMERACDVPRRPVVRVERAKLDVSDARVEADRLCDLAQPDSLPRRNGGPSFDAMMLHAYVCARHCP